MVRPDDDRQLGLPLVGVEASGCTEPAGASPAPVGVGAPGSRPQVSGEIPRARAGCREPLRREQVHGPQHQVNAAASSQKQSGGRAAHFTAKAIPDELVPKRSSGPGGVEAVARVHGSVRNRRDPSASPLSGHGALDKPSVKPAAAQRESEGVVVLPMPVQQNAGGGKDPCDGHVCEAGKREGMASESPPNHLVRPSSDAKVRELRSKLGAAAKQSPGRRFHALYDRVYRSDFLWTAWEQVRRNKGAAGVDSITLADIERYGVARFLSELQSDLQAGTYRPSAVRRHYILKADGRMRPLGIPTIRDRVVQAACKLVIEPIFEADFLDCSHGFRPGRKALGALETLRKRAYRNDKGNHVLDADIRGYFDSIDHTLLMERVALRLSDRRVLKLLRQWL